MISDLIAARRENQLSQSAFVLHVIAQFFVGFGFISLLSLAISEYSDNKIKATGSFRYHFTPQLARIPGVCATLFGVSAVTVILLWPGFLTSSNEFSALGKDIGSVVIASGGILLLLFIFISLITLCVVSIIEAAVGGQKPPRVFSSLYSTYKLVLYQVMAVYLEILLITALLKVLLELISKLSQLFEANTVDFVWRYLLFIVIGFVGILLVQFSVFFYTHKLLKRGLEDKTITDDEVSYVKRLSLVPVVHVIALITLIRKKSKKGVPMPGTMTQLQ
jgi:hypothetical protein